jgi:hypothetical protein
MSRRKQTRVYVDTKPATSSVAGAHAQQPCRAVYGCLRAGGCVLEGRGLYDLPLETHTRTRALSCAPDYACCREHMQAVHFRAGVHVCDPHASTELRVEPSPRTQEASLGVRPPGNGRGGGWQCSGTFDQHANGMMCQGTQRAPPFCSARPPQHGVVAAWWASRPLIVVRDQPAPAHLRDC